MNEKWIIENLKRYLAWCEEDPNLNPSEILDWIREDIELYEKNVERSKR